MSSGSPLSLPFSECSGSTGTGLVAGEQRIERGRAPAPIDEGHGSRRALRQDRDEPLADRPVQPAVVVVEAGHGIGFECDPLPAVIQLEIQTGERQLRELAEVRTTLCHWFGDLDRREPVVALSIAVVDPGGGTD